MNDCLESVKSWVIREELLCYIIKVSKVLHENSQDPGWRHKVEKGGVKGAASIAKALARTICASSRRVYRR